MPGPRSVLLTAVLGCLRDHPHDDTPALIARRLGDQSEAAVAIALTALEDERLVFGAGGHWQLSGSGWQAAGPAPPE